MALAPLLLLALVAAGAAAAWNRSESTPAREPSPDPRARIPEDLTLCRTSPDAVSLLDSSALVRWVSCPGRTAPEVAELVARLEAQAEQFPAAGYAETARSVRTRWNERLDLEDARAAELARGRPAPRPPAARPARTPTPTRTPPNRPATSSAPSASSASSASTLAGELERAEREHPGARARYSEVMRDGTPSELRAAADWIEDQDPSYREIPRALRRRAVEREGARR